MNQELLKEAIKEKGKRNVVTDSNYEGFHDVHQSPIKVLILLNTEL
jgi:hypothetical protein